MRVISQTKNEKKIKREIELHELSDMSSWGYNQVIL